MTGALVTRINKIVTALGFTYITAPRHEYMGISRTENAARNLTIWRNRI